MANTVSSSLAMCDRLPGQGFKVGMPTEYPFTSIVIFAAGVTFVCVKAFATRVFINHQETGTRKIA
jgi:hypothetical protein